jgi:hypothetical protein
MFFEFASDELKPRFNLRLKIRLRDGGAAKSGPNFGLILNVKSKGICV